MFNNIVLPTCTSACFVHTYIIIETGSGRSGLLVSHQGGDREIEIPESQESKLNGQPVYVPINTYINLGQL